MVLKWIKGLMTPKKQDTQIVEITIETARQRAEELQKKAASTAKTIVQSEQDEMKQILAEVRDRLEELEKAKLRNPNIPEKHKHIMDGNRNTYIATVKRFSENIQSQMQSMEPALKSINNSYDKIEDAAEHLAKTVHKPVMVLNEFFGNETAKVQTAIGKIIKQVKESKRSEEYSILAKATEAEKCLKEIENIKKASYALESEKKDYEQKISEEQAKIDHIEEEIRELKQSDEYKNYQNAKKDLEKNQNERFNARNTFNNEFYNIAGILKRAPLLLPNGCPDYVKDAAIALEHDQSLKISSLLEGVQRYIDTATDLKPHRKKKASEAIQNLTSEKIAKHSQKLTTLNQKINEAKQRIDECSIPEKIAHKLSEIDGLQSIVRTLKNSLGELQAKNPEANLHNLRDKLGNALSTKTKTIEVNMNNTTQDSSD